MIAVSTKYGDLHVPSAICAFTDATCTVSFELFRRRESLIPAMSGSLQTVFSKVLAATFFPLIMPDSLAGHRISGPASGNRCSRTPKRKEKPGTQTRLSKSTRSFGFSRPSGSTSEIRHLDFVVILSARGSCGQNSGQQSRREKAATHKTAPERKMKSAAHDGHAFRVSETSRG